MAKNGTEARVDALPWCDLCKYGIGCRKVETIALYDARTSNGQWGFLCQTHYESENCRLGTGFGQRLVVA
jgi:hypothetical protein